jgi:hypothetical protein
MTFHVVIALQRYNSGMERPQQSTRGSEMPQAVERVYLTAVEVAQRYRISERHLRRQVSIGRFVEGIRFGRVYRWRLADLDSWDAQGCPAIAKPRNKRTAKQ